MMVRTRDDIYRMVDLKGKKIGLSKSLNTIKTDWWRIQEEQGIELMLRLNGMTRADVEIVEFPYPDDWSRRAAGNSANDDDSHGFSFFELSTSIKNSIPRTCSMSPKLTTGGSTDISM
jgi:ABC-type nitrate/sulfonate/bicarbonate transport system substrate-binding protein